MRTSVGLLRQLFPSIVAIFLSFGLATSSHAASSSAALSVAITDTSGAMVTDADAVILNTDTNQGQHANSGKSGIVHFAFLKPGHYSLTVSKSDFANIVVDKIVLNVGDDKQLSLILKIGPTALNVLVDGSGTTINTTDGSVSTVIDRQFVANIPLNGRSFQDLISMTPGVVTGSPQLNTTSPGSTGDFSVNGQRTESNYYTVDGVSANVSAGSSVGGGNGAAGVMAATSALGTTQSLLSVDDLQEFRVESSSYSAEYGRSPGGQLAFVTRSGTNAYHGSAYEYFRNGWFDANDWFNDNVGAPKEEVHQNDFGGTIGGPVWIPQLYQGKDKTFFFGSYEGLRMVQPVAATVQYVPDTYMREQPPAAIQPLLNAFPLPSVHGVDYGTPQAPSLAQFFQGSSVPGKIDSTSIRIDHTFTPALSAFFRFADTPSSVNSRSSSLLTTVKANTQTYTFGTTDVLSRSTTNQFHLGYSRSYSGSSTVMDSFGGATPVDLGKPLGSTHGGAGQNLEAQVFLDIAGAGAASLSTSVGHAEQHQWNLTDSLDIAHGNQQWKFGVDFRRLSTLRMLSPFGIYTEYDSAQSVLSNSSDFAEFWETLPETPVYNQVALFAQDAWRINSRISLSGGVRWELAPPPHNATNPQPYTVSGSLGDPSSLTLAPEGTPMWHTSWYSFAPRLGIAWLANSHNNWESTLRIGGGVFFDTNSEAALQGFTSAFGSSTYALYFGIPVPLTSAQQDISIAITPPYNNVYVYPSHMQLPYTNQWNVSVEQEIGNNNAVTISYVGSVGRRLNAKQYLSLSSFNPSFGTVSYFRSVTSDYDALQAKFQRSVTKGVNALVSYTWAHSIDEGSNVAALPVTRGSSDFDVRNSFQGGLTWTLPQTKSSALASVVANGWAVDCRLLARTGYPVTLQGKFAVDASGSEYYTNVDLVPNQPLYLYGKQYPGGRSLNPSAFAYPTGTSLGDAPRNLVRGLGESQVNFAARREFPLSEHTHLQFRAEALNVFNHPNFGYIDPYLTDPTFGQATQMLNQSLGTVAAQYQQGGPRSMQFALKVFF